MIKIGQESQRPVYLLGDGIQMIIILLWPFFFKKSGIISIEEPELYIHPGFQKKFIQFVCTSEKTRHFQIFIATHSNHIVDSINHSDLVSLYTVSKQIKKNALKSFRGRSSIQNRKRSNGQRKPFKNSRNHFIISLSRKLYNLGRGRYRQDLSPTIYQQIFGIHRHR